MSASDALTAAADRSAAFLEVSGLGVRYGNTQVLTDISLAAQQGQVVAVFGPNGAGKSTLLNAICGLVHPSGGHVELAGTDITRWRPHRVARLGVGYVPQGRRLFPYLSAESNVRLGTYPRSDRAAARAEVQEFLDRWPLVKARRDRLAGLLSGGEQQVVALGRALVGNPRLLLLDEPSLGLAPVLVTQLYTAMETLVSDRTRTVVLVEQNVHQALRIADIVYVLVKGRIVHAGPASDLDQVAIASMYFSSGPGGAARA